MNKYLAYTLVALGAFAVIGAGTVSAMGNGWMRGGNHTPEEIVTMHENMFANQAEMLGISVDDFKNAWAEGKNLWQIAEEQGITEEDLRTRMEQDRQDQLKDQLQMLVDKGVITQDQANSRLEAMQDKFEGHEFGRGFHRGFGKGFGPKLGPESNQ